jgi:hypothetical protein
MLFQSDFQTYFSNFEKKPTNAHANFRKQRYSQIIKKRPV